MFEVELETDFSRHSAGNENEKSFSTFAILSLIGATIHKSDSTNEYGENSSFKMFSMSLENNNVTLLSMFRTSIPDAEYVSVNVLRRRSPNLPSCRRL